MKPKHFPGGRGLLPLFVVALCLALLFGVSGCASEKADLSKAKKDYEAGKYAESEEALAEILKDEPENLEALRTMALTMVAQGKNEEAIEQYEKLIEITPTDDEALYSAAVLERLIGRTPDAIAHLEAAVEASSSPVLSDDLARTYMQVGRYEDAVAQWQIVLEQADMDPASRAGIYSAMATAYENARDYDKAKEMLREALALTPDDQGLKARLESLGG